MQYILTEEELRALKASNDVAAQARELAEDYRTRLGNAILEEIRPALRTMERPHFFVERLRAIFQSVPVIVNKNETKG